MNGQWVASVLDALSCCVCEALSNEGAGTPCWCGFMILGEEPPWDYCGECSGFACGYGYVGLRGAFPYTAFPVESEFSNCRGFFGLEIEIGSARCMPVPDERGDVPSPEAVAEASLAVVCDMAALLNAIPCCDLPGKPQLQVQAWESRGPTGGCVGGAIPVFIGAPGG